MVVITGIGIIIPVHRPDVRPRVDIMGIDLFDSSGIEAFVTENNPKYANRIIRQLKAYAKSMGFDKNYNPYTATYRSMPSHEI